MTQVLTAKLCHCILWIKDVEQKMLCVSLFKILLKNYNFFIILSMLHL